jgi:hypothetical protein
VPLRRIRPFVPVEIQFGTPAAVEFVPGTVPVYDRILPYTSRVFSPVFSHIISAAVLRCKSLQAVELINVTVVPDARKTAFA